MKKTQKEFSELLNIPQPTLSAYEGGRNKPTVDVVINIAEKCNVSVNWLCGQDSSVQLNSLGDLSSVLYDMSEDERKKKRLAKLKAELEKEQDMYN